MKKYCMSRLIWISLVFNEDLCFLLFVNLIILFSLWSLLVILSLLKINLAEVKHRRYNNQDSTTMLNSCTLFLCFLLFYESWSYWYIRTIWFFCGILPGYYSSLFTRFLSSFTVLFSICLAYRSRFREIALHFLFIISDILLWLGNLFFLSNPHFLRLCLSSQLYYI